jgi:AraC-like DNA-binding protein
MIGTNTGSSFAEMLPTCVCSDKPGCGSVLNQRRQNALQRIELVIEHMVRHLNESLYISELSRIAGVPGPHFFSVFRSLTGFSPMEFFTRLRMGRACGLLRDQGLSIKQAADIVGYKDAFYFSRTFKKVIGISPRRYRKKMRDRQGEKGVLAPTTIGRRAITKLESWQFSLRSSFEDGGLNRSETLLGNGHPEPSLQIGQVTINGLLEQSDPK